MILPGFVTILGRHLRVQEKLGMLTPAGKEAAGDYSRMDRRIQIDTTVPERYQFYAMWHEALHHAMTLQINGLTDDEEEALVSGFAEIVSDILETNECMRTPWGPEWQTS